MSSNYDETINSSESTETTTDESEIGYMVEPIEKPKTNSEVRFLAIKEAYSENIKRAYITIDVETYKNYLLKTSPTFVLPLKNGKINTKTGRSKDVKLKDYTLFEVLPNYDTKFYFDIENIPRFDDKFIYNIIRDIQAYVKKTSGIELKKYALTINEHSSSHEGLSYHLIFQDYYTTQQNNRFMLLRFLKEYDFYKEYIDTVVYSKNRLFKSANQLNINKNENDFHKVIVGTIEDTIIQNIDGCKLFNYKWKYVQGAGKNSDKFSPDKYDKRYNSGREIKEMKELKEEVVKLTETNSKLNEKIELLINKNEDDEIAIKLNYGKRKENKIDEKELYSILVSKIDEWKDNEKEKIKVKKCNEWLKLFDENGTFGNKKQMIHNFIETFK